MPLSFRSRSVVTRSDGPSPSMPSHNMLVEKLRDAVFQNDVKELQRLLLEGGRARDRFHNDTESGSTVLMEACNLGQHECVDVLTRHCEKSALDARNVTGTTACMLAAEKGHITCLKMLIERGADSDLVDHHGCSSLMLAAIWGNIKCLQYLIENHSDLTKTDIEGRTAVMRVAMSGEIECLEILLTNAIQTSDDASSLESRESLSRSQATNLINCVDRYGSSALMLSLQSKEEKCAELLLDCFADVNIVNRVGKTALRLSFDQHMLPLSRRILEAGANVTLSPNDQMLLHEAAARGENVIARYMILNRCAPTLRDCKHVVFDFPYMGTPISPLCVAFLSKNSNLATYLIAIRFLTRYDVTTLRSCPKLLNILSEYVCRQPLDLLQRFRSKPLTLFTLSFVASSDSMGTGSDREQRIRSSGLPDRFKDQLLFQGQWARLCVSQWQDLALYQDSFVKECFCDDCRGSNGLQFSDEISPLPSRKIFEF
ncbi:serine/threonine-protein phosphatase 6 regulatory ankyrin repeat subunit B [Aplysia californica]|uniref:Serine/threonine-protein phosphatase 6 regulatory ankyrin repeat subunit B n=1 Tax=Aplysia californica TaxID=6500 RepID=A0ABM1VWR7_APLCA|nr:serine/threonine-protein phosphatase 6 regulatory ankyrin repeat subunit B [Aplysia californica]